MCCTRSPSKLEDASYLADLDKRMERAGSGFVLGKGSKTIYASKLVQTAGESDKLLTEGSLRPGKVTFGRYSYEVYAIDFTYGDGQSGQALLLKPLDDIPVYWRPLIAATLLVVVGLISVFMALLVSRSITRPLSVLKNAAISLKEGNLEPMPVPRSKNEIGQVGTAFEEMLTRLRSTIIQMQQYEENRKTLLSHISHDLKTPITAIKGYMEGMLDGVANTPEKQEKYMRTVYRKAGDMDRLIDELFLYSKLDLHKEEFHFRSVDLRTFLLHYLEEQKFELEKMDISLKRRSAAGACAGDCRS